jgi:NADPH:quinone reductase-like Zn-dependent oxidoreductase
VLLASKSVWGHGEPAAGVIAAVHAAEAALQAERLPMLHLRTLNPYIVGGLDLLPEQAAGRGVAAARQAAPLPLLLEQAAISSGISSFAFMGTNAHVVISMPGHVRAAVPARRELAWQRSRSWVAPPVCLLATRYLCGGPSQHQAVLEAQLAAPQLSYLWDHRVAGRAIFPAAGYFLAAAAAANALLDGGGGSGAAAPQLALCAATIPAPLVLPELLGSGGQPVVPVLQVCIDASAGSIAIRSINGGSPGGAATTHLHSKLALIEPATSTGVKAPAVPWLRQLANASALTSAATDPPRGATAAVAASRHGDGCGELNAAVVDSWLQCGQVFIMQELAAGGVYVPASVKLLLLPMAAMPLASGSSNSGLLASVQPEASVGSKQAVSSYTLVSSDGATACTVRRMTAKPLQAAATATPAAATAATPVQQQVQQAKRELLYEVEWQATEAGDDTWPRSAAQLAQSSTSAAAALASMQGMLLQQQLHVQLVSAGSSTLWQPAPPSQVGDDATGAAAAAMMRCVGQEQSRLQLSALQLSTYGPGVKSGAARLAPGPADDSGVGPFGGLQASGALYQPRLLLATAAAHTPSNFQLLPLVPGSLDSLTPVAVDSWPQFSSGSSDGQLLVRVAAVGINFRDVLNVLGMYPGDPGAPGSDFSGVVVSGAQAGAAVFGLAVGALGTAVACSADTVVAMPPCLSFEAASSMPTVFITAQLALGAVSACAAGERVLVHAAAGGVGLAALQVVGALGAHAVATAGSPSKRALLRSLGVRTVVGSRDSAFVGPVAALGGVDVVLNSLTSPGMVGGSLSVLKQGGRFVEIGKRDIWGPAAVAGERPDVAYSLLAIDFMPPAVLQQLLLRVSADMAAGRVAPIRTIVHDLGAVAAALRQMAQARHVGKVVVSAHAAHPLLPGGRSMAFAGCAADAAGGHALVAGGTGALGQLVSAWLAQQQVQHITLCSRSGKFTTSSSSSSELTDASHPLFNSMVTLTSCDVSAAADVSSLFGSIRSLQRPAVSAMLHAGGVLADAALQNQTAAALRQVAAPKSVALRLLAAQLAGSPIASTVLFSSAASLLGSAGQSNYAAANAALDAAARARQAAGLPAVAVQFSAWTGPGMAAETASKVEAKGIGALSPANGLAALEAAVRAGVSMTR